MVSEEYEDICLKCGICCITKKKVGRFYVEKELCKFLDDNCKCTIYKDRLKSKLNNGNYCVTVQESIALGLHPKDCPYIRYYLGNKKYKYKVLPRARNI